MDVREIPSNIPDEDPDLEYTLTYDNMKFLHNKCFFDFDRPDWLEIVKFTVTESGVDTHFAGASVYSGYDHTDHDDFGTFDQGDTCCGAWVKMIQENCNLLKEIPNELYEKFLVIIRKRNAQSKKERELYEDYIKSLKDDVYEANYNL